MRGLPFSAGTSNLADDVARIPFFGRYESFVAALCGARSWRLRACAAKCAPDVTAALCCVDTYKGLRDLFVRLCDDEEGEVRRAIAASTLGFASALEVPI